MPSQIRSLWAMIGSKSSLRAGSKGSPSAGAHVSFCAAITGANFSAIRSRYAALLGPKTCSGGYGCDNSLSCEPVMSTVEPDTIIRPRCFSPSSVPFSFIWSRNVSWSGKMLVGSFSMSLR